MVWPHVLGAFHPCEAFGSDKLQVVLGTHTTLALKPFLTVRLRYFEALPAFPSAKLPTSTGRPDL